MRAANRSALVAVHGGAVRACQTRGMGDVCSSDAGAEAPPPASSDYTDAVNIVLIKGRANAAATTSWTNKQLAALRTNSLKLEMASLNEKRSEARMLELSQLKMEDLQMMAAAIGVPAEDLGASPLPPLPPLPPPPLPACWVSWQQERGPIVLRLPAHGLTVLPQRWQRSRATLQPRRLS